MKCIRDRRWACPSLANSVVATLSVATLLWGGCPAIAQSQLIIPAVDGTGTQITQDGDQFLVTGGQLSGNGRNLFHSFTEFGLDRGQIATFLSRPTIQNILTRVSGGNASVIDGLLRVTGGTSHLFLMNPAGIVFGANARLDVPGSFTATTATGIGLGSNQWFNTVGTPDYAQLVGVPTDFAFATMTPGAIANFGQLSVPVGQSLTLLGGSVLNLGELTAPGGQVTVAAVAGGNWVRLSQAGSLLSLDIQPLPAGAEPFTPAQPIPTLPQLLTGGTLTNANQVTVNPDGSLRLAGSTLDLPTTPGSALISGRIATTSSTQATPSAINLVGQTVALVNATVDASGLQGGTVRIGGDYQGRGSLPNAQRTFIDPGSVIRANGVNPDSTSALGDGGRVIVWSDQVTQFYGQIEAKGGDRAGDGGFVEVSGKHHLTYQGGTNVAAPAGQDGTLLLDPENIWIVPDGTGQNDDLAFTSNTLTISASDFSGTLTLSKNVVESVEGDIILAATNNIEFLLSPGDFLEFNENVTSITLQADGDSDGVGAVLGEGIGLFTSPFATTDINISGATIALGSINTSTFTGDSGSVTFSGTNITMDSINTSAAEGWGGEVFINGGGTVSVGSINTTGAIGDGGNVGLSGTDVYVNRIDTFSTEGGGGAVSINSAGILSVGDINTTSTFGDGGNVELLSTDVYVNRIDTFSTEGWGGNVYIDSAGILSAGDINTSSTIGDGGAVVLLGIDQWVNSISTFSWEGWGGTVYIDSLGLLSVGDINTTSTFGDGGNVELLSTDVYVNRIDTFSSVGRGGAVFGNSTGLLSVGDINTGSGIGDGGTVNLTGVDLWANSISTASGTNGGSVTMSGNWLSVGAIATNGVEGNGGDINLVGDQSIQTGTLVSSTEFGTAGAIALFSATSDLITGDLFADAPNGVGGLISAYSDQGSLFTGAIVTAGLFNGGEVTIAAPAQTVNFQSIDSSSGLGFGGNVLIVAGEFVQGTGRTAANPDATILTTGAIAPGFVTIEHGGGGTRAPFIVGAETSNGLVGGIITGIDDVTASPPTIFQRDYTSPSGWITIIGAENAEAGTPWDDDVRAFETEPEQVDVDLDLEDRDVILSDRSQGNDNLNSDSASDLDEDVSAEFEDYLELPEDENTTNFTPEEQLQNVQTLTGVRPALIYLNYAPSLVNTTLPSPPIASRRLRREAVPNSLGAPDSVLDLTGLDTPAIAQAPTIAGDRHGQLAQAPAKPRSPLTPQPTDQLEVVMVTADGRSQRKIVAGATRAQVQATVQQFLLDISDPRKIRSKAYLANAQQLYRWLVQPIEAELVNRKISNLAFIADTGLRFIPMAALHDGKQFLIEKYSIGLMPSLSLTDTRFVSLKNEPVLAMGASEFASKPELPAVPTELSLITQQIRSGRAYLNQEFTLDNLKTQRQQEGFKIVHLATHGEFQAGAISNSYIQLWDTQLRLDQIRQLGWSNPPVELLVLSACRTALGSDEAELGFAGFAVQSGVKSAIASLWSVSDEGTLGLMTEFYRQLDLAPVRAEALRQAQIAMAQGRVKFINGQLQDGTGRLIPLPPDLAQMGDRDLSHPYYWAAFTMIGSPW